MPHTGRKNKEAQVADIIAVMEDIAPSGLVEEWDNCGLQIGSRQWPVHTLWVALDPHPAVIEAAAREGVDMLITHHPLLFQPVQRIDGDTPIGKLLQTALEARLAVFSAHTNLDSAEEGVNDLLSQRVGLLDVVAMVPAVNLRTGNHRMDNQRMGMGRIGCLPESISLEQLARQLKSALDLSAVKMCGDPQSSVQRVALCSGSGSGLLDEFFASDAQVYISGDLRYHDARAALDLGRALIDVGHFASERILIQALADRLQRALREAGRSVAVTACRIEQDPFQYL